MRRIDADKLGEVKFHSLPYTHITPSDVEAESYKRGWNDAIDSIIDNAPTIEPERKNGKWVDTIDDDWWKCSNCGSHWRKTIVEAAYMIYCPNCGSYNGGDNHD